MSHQDQSIAAFLEAIRYMPNEEALEEALLRRDFALEQLAVVKTHLHDLELAGKRKESNEVRAAGQAVSIACCDLARLNDAIKEIKKRQVETTWARAVRAVYGHEGYERCRLWMIQNQPLEPVDPEYISRLLAKYGCSMPEGVA